MCVCVFVVGYFCYLMFGIKQKKCLTIRDEKPREIHRVFLRVFFLSFRTVIVVFVFFSCFRSGKTETKHTDVFFFFHGAIDYFSFFSSIRKLIIENHVDWFIIEYYHSSSKFTE